jgi:sugar phosphate isomerase/epimerase
VSYVHIKIMNRRIFLKNTGVAALGGLLLSEGAWASARAGHPIGVQLFTVMKEIDQDLNGTLKKIADLGYKEIESAFSMKGGFYGLRPKEFNSLLKDLGLTWKSHHVIGAPFKMPPDAKPLVGADGKPFVIPPMRNLKENHQELVDEVAEGGVQYLVCANIPTYTGVEVNEAIPVLAKTAEAAKKAGVTFCYHNHDAEFKDVEGKKPFDQFASQISADLMKFELDLAWATKAGADPVELFKKHPGRFPLWHVKDLDKDMAKILPVGQGVVDYKRIFANAKQSGMKHFFVEHDMPENAFESLATSAKYVKEEIKP